MCLWDRGSTTSTKSTWEFKLLTVHGIFPHLIDSGNSVLESCLEQDIILNLKVGTCYTCERLLGVDSHKASVGQVVFSK